MRSKVSSSAIILLVFGLAAPVSAQFALGIQILETYSGSARSIGMGGVALPYSDGIDAANNPSGYAFQFTERFIAVNVAQQANWLKEYANDLHHKQASYGVGYSFSQLKPERESKFDIAIGLAYTSLKFDYGSIGVPDLDGAIVDTVNPNDEIAAYTLSIGLTYYIELGIGFNHKRISSDFMVGGRPPVLLTGATNSSDIAFCARLPLHNLLPGMLAVNRGMERPLGFKVTPFISRVESGDHNKYLYQSERVSLPLPELVHQIYGIDIAVRLGRAPLLSLVYASEDQELTATGGLNNPDQTNVYNADREGTEIGLAGTLFIRSGSYKSTDSNINIDTDGWGLSSRGLVDWLIDRNVIHPGDNWIGLLLDRLEIRYDHAKYSTDNVGLDNTTFNSFSISL